MRRTRPLLVALCLLGGATAPAGADTLPVRLGIDVVINPFPIFVNATGSGVAGVNLQGPSAALTSLTLPSGVFRATGLDFPGTGAISQVRVTASNGPGLFTGLTPNGGGGVMGLPGIVNLCILATCDVATNVLMLPLDPVGAGGTARVTGALTVTVSGTDWTKGITTISTPFAVTILEGFAHGPLSGTGTTAQPGGVLELVTPAVVKTSVPALGELTGYAVLRVTFVPEPASAALLGAGLALLAQGARRRARS